MYATLTTTRIQPEQMNEFIRTYQHQAVPVARTIVGFQRLSLLVDRNTGTMTILVFYDTEAHARTAGTSAQVRHLANLLSLLESQATCQVYEAALEVDARPTRAPGCRN